MAECKGCGRRIVWAELTNDKGERVRVPLDPSAPVYREVPFKGWQRDRESLVSHWSTCPKTDEIKAAQRRARESGGA